MKLIDKTVFGFFILLSTGVFVLYSLPCGAAAGGDKEKQNAQTTAADLQLSLMNYADVVSTLMAQAAYSSKVNELPPEVRRQVLGDLAATVFSVYTNAGDPNPLIGMLNTAVIISFGKMVYEQNWYKKYGKQMEIVVSGFRKLDEEIWRIVSQVLTPEQQKELRNMILELRRAFPDLVDFTQLRFNDFESLRKESALKSKVKSGGIFAPVSEATRQIEETRQLAERALFLATRLPLTAGVFMDAWLSQWLANPDMKDLTTDLKKISTSVHELTSIVEDLPDQVQQVGITTVNRVMDRIAEERGNLIRDLGAEQERLSGLLTQFRETVNAGEALITSVDGLAERVGLSPENPLTVDVDVYRKTVEELRGAATELTALVVALDELAASPEIQTWLPFMKNGIEQLTGESKKIINHVFLMSSLAIILSMVSFFALRLVYVYALKRFEVKS